MQICEWGWQAIGSQKKNRLTKHETVVAGIHTFKLPATGLLLMDILMVDIPVGCTYNFLKNKNIDHFHLSFCGFPLALPVVGVAQLSARSELTVLTLLYHRNNNAREFRDRYPRFILCSLIITNSLFKYCYSYDIIIRSG